MTMMAAGTNEASDSACIASRTISNLQAPVAVSATLGRAVDGWVRLNLTVGGQHHVIACCDVFDPFPNLLSWMVNIAGGLNGAVEIDEDGVKTTLWADREPGSPTIRLRVFRPSFDGIAEALIDAEVDGLEVVGALYPAFRTFAERTIAQDWGVDNRRSHRSAEDTLRKIRSWNLENQLRINGMPWRPNLLINDWLEAREEILAFHETPSPASQAALQRIDRQVKLLTGELLAD